MLETATCAQKVLTSTTTMIVVPIMGTQDVLGTQDTIWSQPHTKQATPLGLHGEVCWQGGNPRNSAYRTICIGDLDDSKCLENGHHGDDWCASGGPNN